MGSSSIVADLTTNADAHRSVSINADISDKRLAIRAGLHDPARLSGDFWNDWRALEQQSAPNPFFGTALTQAALSTLDDRSRHAVRLLTITDHSGLIAALPVIKRGALRGLPIAHLVSWRHDYAFYDQPLIRRERAHEGAAIFSKALSGLPGRPLFLQFTQLDHAGDFAQGAASHPRSAVEPCFERACLRAPIDADLYLEAALRKKKRKELSRLFRRMSEHGDVRFETLPQGADTDVITAWTDAFLSLEHAGWKGECATSMRTDTHTESFFRHAIAAAHGDGTLDFRSLCVGERRVAMIVSFIAHGEGYSFKIAHDPEFARYSPGVQLEIELTRAFAHMDGVHVFDSCGAPDHPMINHIWRERRTMAALTITSDTVRGRAFHAAYSALRRLSPHSAC